MEHTNKIAIQILKDQYSDYPENAWHYDEQYKMIVKGIELSKEVPVAGVTDEETIKKIFEHGADAMYYTLNPETGQVDQQKYDIFLRKTLNLYLRGNTEAESEEYLRLCTGGGEKE